MGREPAARGHGRNEGGKADAGEAQPESCRLGSLLAFAQQVGRRCGQPGYGNVGQGLHADGQHQRAGGACGDPGRITASNDQGGDGGEAERELDIVVVDIAGRKDAAEVKRGGADDEGRHHRPIVADGARNPQQESQRRRHQRCGPGEQRESFARRQLSGKGGYRKDDRRDRCIDEA